MATLPLPARARGCCAAIARPIDPVAERSLARALKALADETRLQVVSMLKRSAEPICVCDLVASFGLSQPTISHHMRKLRNAGLVTAERRGIWAHYSLRTDQPPAIKRLVDSLP